MKHTYILLLAFFLVSGCSSYGEGPDRNAEMKAYKKQLDSLNRVKIEQQRILDSLENASRIKEEQLMKLKIEQDSLNRILKEENK